MGKRGQRTGLDENKRGQVLAILSVGCSQNRAAEYVGCAPATIRRTAERDPKFAKALREVKGGVELGLIRQVRSAAKKEQYWRAAAWALERLFPEKYARRGPDVITADQLARALAQLAETIVQQVPVGAYRKNIVKGVEALARSFGQTIEQDLAEEETAGHEPAGHETPAGAAAESKEPTDDPV